MEREVDAAAARAHGRTPGFEHTIGASSGPTGACALPAKLQDQCFVLGFERHSAADFKEADGTVHNDLDIVGPRFLSTDMDVYRMSTYTIGQSAGVSSYTDCCGLCHAARETAASAAVSLTPQPASNFVVVPDDEPCNGIIFWTHADGGERCTLSEGVTISTGREQSIGSDTFSGHFVGDYIFKMTAPPPPPFIPQMSACNDFYPHERSQIQTGIGGAGSAAAAQSFDIPGSVSITAPSHADPWECCQACLQEPLCMGFNVAHQADLTGYCEFRAFNYVGINNVDDMTAWAYRSPPSPPPPGPPPSPPPPSPPPPSPPPSPPPPRHADAHAPHSEIGLCPARNFYVSALPCFLLTFSRHRLLAACA